MYLLVYIVFIFIELPAGLPDLVRKIFYYILQQ